MATGSYLSINNYLKHKWVECPNQKTKIGWMDTKTRPLYMLSTRVTDESILFSALKCKEKKKEWLKKKVVAGWRKGMLQDRADFR